jgi:hypothetical protein
LREQREIVDLRFDELRSILHGTSGPGVRAAKDSARLTIRFTELTLPGGDGGCAKRFRRRHASRLRPSSDRRLATNGREMPALSRQPI